MKKIHNDHVGVQLSHKRDCLREIVRLADCFNIVVKFQKAANRLPQKFSIVGNDYRDWHKGASQKITYGCLAFTRAAISFVDE
jgi:hypothetical protein